MSFAVRNIQTGETWVSYRGKTVWAKPAGAKQAFAACESTRLDDSTTHELVDLTMIQLAPYKTALKNLVAAINMGELDHRKLDALKSALLAATELLEPIEQI